MIILHIIFFRYVKACLISFSHANLEYVDLKMNSGIKCEIWIFSMNKKGNPRNFIKKISTTQICKHYDLNQKV